MFLAGGFARLGLNYKAAGEIATAKAYSSGAVAMIFLFTATFGATWLTVSSTPVDILHHDSWAMLT